MNLQRVCGFMLMACFSSIALSAPDWNEETLTGDWGGLRSRLFKQGVSLDFTHKSDVLNSFSGGLQSGTAWMGHTEARISFDMASLVGLRDSVAFISYHSQLGSKFARDYVGNFAGVDNIETEVNTAKLFQAWLQKGWLKNKLSVRAGLYAVDSEFDVTESSSLFMQPSYGISNEIAQSGPPIFATGALGVRVKYTNDSGSYMQAVVTDGVPGDPNNPWGTHVQLNKGDGTLSMAEIGHIPAEMTVPFEKVALGMWRYSRHFDDLSDVDDNNNPLQRVGRGVYVLAEKTLISNPAHIEQGMTGFFRMGTASKDVYQVDWLASAGLRYQGLFDSRDDDIAGVAITCNHASRKYRQLNNAKACQTDIELMYRVQVTPWLALQPSLQHIRVPNMDGSLRNSNLLAVRADMVL